MSDDRMDPDIRKGALLLSALVLTPDDALEHYRDTRIGDESVDVEAVRRARGVLDAVACALRSPTNANWRRLEQAWEILRKNEPPQAAAPAEPAKPRAEPRVDAPAAPREPLAVPASPSPPSYSAAVPPSGFAGGSASTAASPWAAPDEPAAVGPDIANLQPVAPDDTSPAVLAIGDMEDLDGTLGYDANLLGADVLPFAPAGPDTPVPASTTGPSVQSGETAFVPALVIDDPTPFGSPGQAEAPAASSVVPAGLVGSSLTLEQYASFCAEREARGSSAELARRYGLSDSIAIASLDANWRSRTSSDRQLGEHLAALIQRYQDWLATSMG